MPLFLRFVEHTIRALGDLISEYITINEPNVYATNGYFFGTWPPGEASFSRTLYVMSVLCAAHIAGYACIHRVRRELGFGDTRVAFATICAYSHRRTRATCCTARRRRCRHGFSRAACRSL